MKIKIKTLFSKFQESVEDQQQVHPALQVSLYAILLAGGIASLFTIGRTGFVPVTTLLDVWTILFITVSVFRGHTRFYIALYLFILYCLTRIVPALVSGAPLYDFLQAYRWLMYIIAFLLAAGRKWGDNKRYVQFTWLLLSIAILKYLTTFVAFSGNKRPILFLENNFELALFAGIIAVGYKNMGKLRMLSVLGMGVLTFLSGSRSGAVSFVILAVFAIFQIRSARRILNYVAITLIPLVIAVAVWIFIQRTPNLNNIDRVRFAKVLFQETESWNIANFLFGTVPITPLTTNSCQQLSYYWELFSSTGDGSCYSVIFHAFVLRIIFDAGIFGLIISFAIPIYLLIKSKVNIGLLIALVGIAFANSVSVSGLNNPYVCLPIILALLIPHDTSFNRREYPLDTDALNNRQELVFFKKTDSPHASFRSNHKHKQL